MRDTILRRFVEVYVLWADNRWTAEAVELTEDECDLTDDTACAIIAETKAEEKFAGLDDFHKTAGTYYLSETYRNDDPETHP